MQKTPVVRSWLEKMCQYVKNIWNFTIGKEQDNFSNQSCGLSPCLHLPNPVCVGALIAEDICDVVADETIMFCCEGVCPYGCWGFLAKEATWFGWYGSGWVGVVGRNRFCWLKDWGCCSWDRLKLKLVWFNWKNNNNLFIIDFYWKPSKINNVRISTWLMEDIR